MALAAVAGALLVGLCVFQLLQVEREVQRLREANKKACIELATRAEEHEGRLNNHLKLLAGLTRAGEIAAARTDRVVDAHDKLRVRVVKLSNIAEIHQTTLDVVGLALGVKNPRPGDERPSC